MNRQGPRDTISRARLETKVAADHWGRAKELGGGHLAVIQGDLGFSAEGFHVSVYQASPGFLSGDRMALVTSESFEELADAHSHFEGIGR